MGGEGKERRGDSMRLGGDERRGETRSLSEEEEAQVPEGVPGEKKE
jgi:hypothetical protein